MPYVVFIKAPNLDYLRYQQYNDKQRMSKMKTVEFLNTEKNKQIYRKISFFFCFRKVIWEIIHH